MPQTGATRYQKFLKSEKAKTKLKGKKDLPKGTNVTKTNFKVKKIVIKEQLKKHSDTEALSKRKLNLKELVSRLNHFNVKTRTDSLDGIKELATAHPDTVIQNLGQIILGVAPLLLNVEKVVRRESLKLLHIILSTVPIENIEPFFDILSTYLRSTMTHIDTRIQEDSLLFLDILLLCTSEKMVQDFHKITPNFLDMISKLRVDSKPGRTLTVNLDSQNTSVRWRIKVLHRLKDYLLKYSDKKICPESDISSTKAIHKFDAMKINQYPLFNPIYTSVCHIPCFSSKNWQETVKLNEVEKFKEYIDTLMPLLFETWLEVCPPTKTNKNIETVVNEDAALLLKHSLEVIALLWKVLQYLQKKNPSSDIVNYFGQKYRQSFTQHFVLSFPYVTKIRAKLTKTDDSPFDNTITDPKLIIENLELCYLFILINPQINIKSQTAEISAILNYIQKTFSQNINQDISNSVIKIMHTIFSNEITSWTKPSQILNPLFIRIVKTYFSDNTPIEFKQEIFALLCKIALNDKMAHFHTCDFFKNWIINLPDILLERSITVQTIDIIHQFAVRNNETFNTVVKSKLQKIITNLPLLEVSDAKHDTNSYHKLFSLFFWIKSWDTESLNLLEKQLIHNVYKSDHGKYIFDILNLKSGNII